jgi:hypothetical protein
VKIGDRKNCICISNAILVQWKGSGAASLLTVAQRGGYELKRYHDKL